MSMFEISSFLKQSHTETFLAFSKDRFLLTGFQRNKCGPVFLNCSWKIRKDQFDVIHGCVCA